MGGYERLEVMRGYERFVRGCERLLQSIRVCLARARVCAGMGGYERL